jgi:hypothetical protein
MKQQLITLTVPQRFMNLETQFNELRWLSVYRDKVERVFKDFPDIKSHLLNLYEETKDSILNPIILDGSLQLNPVLTMPPPVQVDADCVHKSCEYCDEVNCPTYIRHHHG